MTPDRGDTAMPDDVTREGGEGVAPQPPIGLRLRALLARHGVRPTELARRLGMSRQTLNEILAGTTKNPGIATVERMVAAAGGTMKELYEVNEKGSER